MTNLEAVLETEEKCKPGNLEIITHFQPRNLTYSYSLSLFHPLTFVIKWHFQIRTKYSRIYPKIVVKCQN